MSGLLDTALTLALTANADQLFSTLKKVPGEVDKMEKDTEGSTSKMQHAFNLTGKAASAAGTAVIGAGAGVAGLSIAAAVAGQATDEKLNTAIKNTGSSMKALQPQIDATDAKMRNYGFTNDDTNTALAQMTTALHSPQKAMADLGIAADLARQKNISLSQAAMLVTKTAEGQPRALQSVGIQLAVVGSTGSGLANAQLSLSKAQQKVNEILQQTPGAANPASKAYKSYQSAVQGVQNDQQKLTMMQGAGNQMLSALSQRLGGTAAGYSKTFAGSLAVAKAQVTDMGEKIGDKLLPALTNALKDGEAFFGFLSKNKGVAIALGAAIGVIATTLAAYSIAVKVAAVAETLFNTSLDANPVMLIVLAIAGLIAVIVLLVSHWKQVTEFLKAAWSDVGSFFKSVGNAIASWWNGFWGGITGFVRTVFGAVGDFIKTVFKDVANFFESVGSTISSWWNGFWGGIGSTARSLFQGIHDFVRDTWNDFLSFFRSVGTNISAAWNKIWSGLGSVVRGAFNDVKSFIKTAIDDIVNVINGMIGGINSAAGLLSGLGINIKIPKIPLPSFDNGGTIPGPLGSPQLIIGHGGEEVVSLAMQKGTQPMPQSVISAAQAQSAPSSSSAASSRGGNTYIVQASTNASPQQIMAEFGWMARRSG
jgi:hypothetical protein